MIRDHQFNSRWWGGRVGIVHDASFFSLAGREQQEKLRPYAWVEFRSPLEPAPPLRKIHSAGFFQVDVQLRTRGPLGKNTPDPMTRNVTVRFADESPFTISASDVAVFEHERFWHLPGITEAKLNERYVMWSNQLIADYPGWCLQVFHKDSLQGWFLSQPEGDTGDGIDLTLAMMHRDAYVSGLLLYDAAFAAYSRRGAKSGVGGSSVSNINVLNISRTFDVARFTSAEGCWLWISDGLWSVGGGDIA